MMVEQSLRLERMPSTILTVSGPIPHTTISLSIKEVILLENDYNTIQKPSKYYILTSLTHA